MKGQFVAPGVEFYVAAASSNVQAESERRGDWDTLVAAGAKVLPAGCGPCIGLGTGLLEEGETGISATNRNYKGRMGHPKAQAYLASPAVVAASAIKGYIASPESLDQATLPPYDGLKVSYSSASPSSSKSAANETVELIEGFPSVFSGPLLFAPQDNLNTDGIYPGKYTYQDDMTLEQQAKVVMENYDPTFASTVAQLLPAPASTPRAVGEPKLGAVLVAGYNFGTGSSREQAATALKSAGVPIVLAGSFGDIFKRNAINNGLVCMECPELVSDLTELFAKDGKRGQGGKDGKLTVEPQWTVSVSMTDGTVSVQTPEGPRTYQVKPVGASVQDLWICGGLEGYVLRSIRSQAQ